MRINNKLLSVTTGARSKSTTSCYQLQLEPDENLQQVVIGYNWSQMRIYNKLLSVTTGAR